MKETDINMLIYANFMDQFSNIDSVFLSVS